MFSPTLTVQKYTQISKHRELPISGNILVKDGDKVSSQTVIANADLPGELHILKISEKLGISPEEVLNSLKFKSGDNIKEKDLICEYKGLFGLFKSRFYSPVNGILELISEGSGNIGIRERSVPLNLTAYISGTVTNIEHSKSVTIENDFTYIQGIFGVGGEKYGNILILDDKLSLEQLQSPDECKGKIIVTRYSPNISLLNTALEKGATGFICSSIDDSTLTQFLGYEIGIALTGDESIPMTLIITEGFGKLQMSSRIYDLLKASSGSLASINGATQVRAGAVRPEIIIELSEENKKLFKEEAEDKSVKSKNQINTSENSLLIDDFSKGTKVRIIREPYFGEVGEVVDCPKEEIKIPTGAFVRIVNVSLSSIEPNSINTDKKILAIPRANLEML